MTTKLKPRPTFATACARYVHRFTCDHVPAWASEIREDGSYYAPQYASDREWYEHTAFEGEHSFATGGSCYSTEQSWPLGEKLARPYRRGMTKAEAATAESTPSQQPNRALIAAAPDLLAALEAVSKISLACMSKEAEEQFRHHKAADEYRTYLSRIILDTKEAASEAIAKAKGAR